VSPIYICGKKKKRQSDKRTGAVNPSIWDIGHIIPPNAANVLKFPRFDAHFRVCEQLKRLFNRTRVRQYFKVCCARDHNVILILCI